MLSATLALCAVLAGAPAGAQSSTATALGYVVRVEPPRVFLDLGASAGASVGRGFEIYTEGAELKHPVTGAVLGRVENVIARGQVSDVEPLYSVGTLSAPAEIKAGMRARFVEAAPAAAPAAPSAPAAAPEQTSVAPRWKSPGFDFEINGLAVADFSGAGKPQLALASPQAVSLYPYPPRDAKPVAQATLSGVSPRVLSMTAADLKGDGRAQLFVSLYDQAMDRVETRVLELDGQGKLQVIAELPFLVRGVQEASGRLVLASQQLVEDQTFPFSGIYPLVYKDGKFEQGSPSLAHKRADFLYEFTHAELDGKPAMLYLTDTNHLRVQFDSGYWKTRDAYGQTPVRLRWPQTGDGRLLEFHPPILAGTVGGQTRIYAISNHSMLGSLSEPFGLFNGGDAERMSWDGVALKTDWKADLGGYSTALQLVPGPENPADLVVAVAGTSGRSAVWIFNP